MRLLSLQLENIKSYGPATRIEFSEGLNAVCGLNGAGKTTLLESIGYVLFDYIPYSVAGFIREGQKAGTVRLQVLAADGRQYEIVRRIGAGATWYVVDLAEEFRLAERPDNVKQWIRSQLLDIEGAVDLGSLFQSAVGVAQGAMTADFLGTPAARKSTFDSLLRVEEYRGAEKQLRETVSYLRDQRAGLQTQMAELEGETKRLPQVEASEKELAARLASAERGLETLERDLQRAQLEKEAQDEAERKLNELRTALAAAATDVSRSADALKAHEDSRERARAARKIVDDARVGRDLFLAAQARLKELEGRRRERERLEKDAARVETDVAIYSREVESHRQNLGAARVAGEQAALLAEPLARQTELERLVRDAEIRLAGKEEVERRAEESRRELDRIDTAVSAREDRMAEASAAREDAAGIEAAVQHQASVQSRLNTLAHQDKQKPDVEEQGKLLRQQMDQAQADAKEAAKLELRRVELDQRCREGTAVREEHARLREELAGISASLDFQDVARRELGNRHCPLLDLECPVVTADGSFLTRFDVRVRDLKGRSAQVHAALKESEPRLQAAANADEEAGKLRIELATLAGAFRTVEDLEPQLRKTRHRYAALNKDLAERPTLLEESARLDAEIARLTARRDVAASLPGLLEQQDSDEKARRATVERLADLEASRQDMVKLEDVLRKTQNELAALNDPRARRQMLASLASRVPEIEKELVEYEARLDGSRARLATAQEELRAYESLDAEIEAEQTMEAKHRPAYEAHLKSSDEAAQLEDRELAVSESSKRLEAARTAEIEVRSQEAEAAVLFDPDRHALLKARHQQLLVDVATSKQSRDRTRSDLAETREDLHNLRVQRQRLAERQTELGEAARVARAVDFIRETIAAAGPAVTEMLLASISQSAAVIYSEIMDDHAYELRWDQDYEILVQLGAESRRFAQLSGGEQMSAALAVRLALLREMSEVDFAFFDEPTQNMDEERRANLAAQIGQIKGFEQLIVISHDDTFEHNTDNLIRLEKVHEQTLVEAS